ATLDAVAVVEGDHADVLEQFVVGRLEVLGEQVEVEQLSEPGVEQLLLHAAGDVRGEVLAVELLELRLGLIVAEHALVDRLEQQARRHGVEGRVVFDVLKRDLDDRLIQLLGRDAVEQGQFEFARDLGDPGDVLVEAGARVLDGEVDLVGVVRLALPIALDYGDCHVCSSNTVTEPRPDNARTATLISPKWPEWGHESLLSSASDWPSERCFQELLLGSGITI